MPRAMHFGAWSATEDDPNVALDLRSHGFGTTLRPPWAVPWWTGRLTTVAPVRGAWTPHATCSLTAVDSSTGRGGSRAALMSTVTATTRLTASSTLNVASTQVNRLSI